MRLLSLVKRGAAVIALSAVMLFLGVSVYFRIEQYRFRRQAEGLLADVRGLELGKASYADVERMTNKWDFGPSLPQGKTCTNDGCDYFLQLRTLTDRAFAVNRGRLRDATVARILTLLGQRPAVIQVRIGVRERVLRSELFSVLLLVHGGEGDDEILSASAGTTPNHSDREQPSVKLSHWLKHPAYLVGEYRGVNSADFNPKSAPTIWAEFSKDASIEDTSRLMRFDLGCLTSFRSCTVSSLMPTVWAQVQDDRRASYPAIACSLELARRVAALSDLIAVVRPTTVALQAHVYEAGPYKIPAVDIIRFIKKPRFWRSDKSVDIQIDTQQTPIACDTGADFQPGQQYIVLIEQHTYGIDSAALYPCGVLTLNDANLAMVREAAAEAGQDVE